MTSWSESKLSLFIYKYAHNYIIHQALVSRQGERVRSAGFDESCVRLVEQKVGFQMI